jgi:serine/threonine-protein kinase HipA
VSCLVCLRATTEPTGYHRACAQELWGTRALPTLEVDPEQLSVLAVQMVEGRATISGVQRKLSVNLTADRLTLRVVAGGGRYILKPQSPGHAALPENEHLTMRLATLLDIPIPPCGLVRMRDGSLAYLVARFDRPREGGKRRQEDFCQLAELRPIDKYDRSAELCVRLIRRYSVQPPIDLVRLYRQVVFSWWVGNGDLHLKNLSLLEDDERLMRLSPAYDLLSTAVVLGVPHMALKISGRDNNLTPKTWREFAQACGITPNAARRVLQAVPKALPRAENLVRRSYLPAALQEQYVELLKQRATTFLLGEGARQAAAGPRAGD